MAAGQKSGLTIDQGYKDCTRVMSKQDQIGVGVGVGVGVGCQRTRPTVTTSRLDVVAADMIRTVLKLFKASLELFIDQSGVSCIF